MRRVGKDWPSEMDVTLGVYCRAESEEKRGDRPFKGQWYEICAMASDSSAVRLAREEIRSVARQRRVEGGSRVGDCLSSPNLCPWPSEGFCDDGESA